MKTERFSHVLTFESMGTVWKVSFKEFFHEEKVKEIEGVIQTHLTTFNNVYSRFNRDSFISKLQEVRGVVEVPHDLVAMLRLYAKYYMVSDKKFTPCIGALLEDAGYDDVYSFQEKESKRPVPDFFEAVKTVDDTHIFLNDSVLLDLGALGKGYCVDRLVELLRPYTEESFLVDGSGDVYYVGNDSLAVGLEDPDDTTQVIGVIAMTEGGMCSSSTNRRAWGRYSHYLDPTTTSSPSFIRSSWVLAQTAAEADALSSVLFFVAPEKIEEELGVTFSYCLLNNERHIKKSPNFLATFFS